MPAKWQDLGTTLREAREQKGVSIAQAQQATKIRQAFLEALEKNDYSILPPAVYVRGFVKNYSSYLGLDPQQMVSFFDEMMEAIAAGYEPEYGSSDSGGRGVHANLRSEVLSGLSQGEARLLEHGPESLNFQSLPQVEPEETAVEATEADEPKDGVIAAQPIAPSRALARVEPPHPPVGLRPYEKYVLRPAIQPINKPALYIPNFIPMVLVLIIVAAACLLLYRGLIMPPSNSSGTATTTATVEGVDTATATDLTAGSVTGGASADTTQAEVADAVTPPNYASVVAGNSAITNTSVSKAPVGNVTTTAPPAPTPTVAPTAKPTTIGPTPTPTPDPNAVITVTVTVTQNDSWLSVVVDGNSVFSKFLYATDGPQTYTGKRIEVRAGAPGVIDIKVNGVDQPYNKPNGGIITHVYTPTGDQIISG